LVVAVLVGLAINLAPAAGPPSVQAAPPSGPVAEWTFDETSGTTAHDAASTHDGTLLGNPTWSPSGGHDGSGALVFDGDGDGVQVPTAAALEPTSISILMWMKGARTANGQWDTLLQKGANACEAGSYGLQAYARTPTISPGELLARVETNTVGNYAGFVSPEAALWNGDWHLVGWTYDAVSEAGTLYIDGIASAVGGIDLIYGLPTASDLFIGREPVDCPDSRDFQGSLDDVRIYDRVLGASEVQAMVPSVSTSATFAIETNPLQWSQWTWATVTVTPTPVESAEVRVYDVSNGGHVLKAINGTSPETGIATLQLISGDLQPFDVGSYDLVAEVSATGPYEASVSNHETLVVGKFVNAVSIDGPTSAMPGSTVQLTGTVSNYTDGTATFYEDHGGGNVDSIGSAPLVWNNGNYVVTIQTAPLDLGDHTFFMRISETAHFAEGTTDSHVVHVAEVASWTGISVGGTLQTHHPLTLYASVGPLNSMVNAPAPSGTVTFRDGATTLGTVDLATTNQWVVSSAAVGAHSYTAEYSGDGFYLGSTSDPAAITIVADTVDATGLGVQYTTFYPVTDGYRDTDAIKGTRLEPLSVSIKVYNSSNSVVRSASYARATGAYSYPWNGRNSSGTVLAAGKYRIVQTLTDAFGTKKAWTFYVYLSTKKLVTHSTYVTKYAYPPTAFTAGGTGAGYYNSTSKYVKLVAGYDGVVLAGWQFALPSATVYKSLKFQVYAKSPATVFNAIAGQNFSVCGLTTTWYVDCFDHWHGIGGSSTAWFSTSLSPTYNRIGRTVRGLIDVEYGTVYVYKVRVYVSYATLQ
jgi:hypothetical protein